MTIAISISKSEDIAVYGMGQMHLQDAMVEVARFLLKKDHQLIYGGDLNYTDDFNFTELLFQLAMTYGGNEQRVTNYAVFPLYLKITKAMEADVLRVATIERVNTSPEFEAWTNKRYDNLTGDERAYIDRIIKGEDNESKKIWSDHLTLMRKIVNGKIQCRIVMGGKLNTYQGAMPGVVEEALLAMEAGITVFIDGRMGGAAAQLIQLIKEDTLKTKYPQFAGLPQLSITDLAPDRMVVNGKQAFPELEKYFTYFLL